MDAVAVLPGVRRSLSVSVRVWLLSVGRFSLFPFEKLSFEVLSPMIVSDAAIGTHDTVAGNEEGEGIGCYGIGYGTDSIGAADALCDLLIGGGLSKRDHAYLTPYRFLEVSTFEIEDDEMMGSVKEYFFDDLCHAVVLHGRGIDTPTCAQFMNSLGPVVGEKLHIGVAFHIACCDDWTEGRF